MFENIIKDKERLALVEAGGLFQTCRAESIIYDNEYNLRDTLSDEAISAIHVLVDLLNEEKIDADKIINHIHWGCYKHLGEYFEVVRKYSEYINEEFG